MFRFVHCFGGVAVSMALAASALAQVETVPANATTHIVSFHRGVGSNSFSLAENGRVAPIYIAPESPESVKTATEAFAGDLDRVTGMRPKLLASLAGKPPEELVIVGVLGHSSVIDDLRLRGKLRTASIEGKWESAITTVVSNPMPGVHRALVIVGSDRRGAAFALFTLSRQMGVSPWTWWADVPVLRHDSVYVQADDEIQNEPSVKYRGIFLNDEDWGLRPWAAAKMDPEVGNIGPHTYAKIFELLVRLHANSLWPAMHPGTLAFNAVQENARLADRWGIVMGSSHSEALLRNNVGEWNEKRDGPWNYQKNSAAIDRYWQKRLEENGRYENYYTVGMRGVHDSGLEATGTREEKARLVEQVMAAQRGMLGKDVNPKVQEIPQVIWLYKESLDLYRAGMSVPDDVTLGWTDDNYGYLRQLPNAAEQKRSGGSGVYYHVSYWGSPHDYLWLCTTPPALIREEMTKAFDHRARRYWILNVGDLKPAEADIDYFLQLAWDEPRMASMSQSDFLQDWFAEQFPAELAPGIARLMQSYYRLNFVRKPEFMGFNGYNDGIQRTRFNPLAWGDQNQDRARGWQQASDESAALAKQLPPQYHDAFVELVSYPVQAAAAQNQKFLSADRSYLDASLHDLSAMGADAANSQAAYDRILHLTEEYNALARGKWSGMMSASPRNRQVFAMPQTADAKDENASLPLSWKAFQASSEDSVAIVTRDAHPPRFVEQNATVSINASHYTRAKDVANAQWQVLKELGISGDSLVFGSPGLLANEAQSEPQATAGAPWVEYEFQTSSAQEATLTLSLLPTFPVDSTHRLRYAVALDGQAPTMLDASGSGEWHEKTPATWATNVLSNASEARVALGVLQPGRHTVRLIDQDPGVVFEHLTIAFPGAPSAYPVPPETVMPFSTLK